MLFVTYTLMLIIIIFKINLMNIACYIWWRKKKNWKKKSWDLIMRICSAAAVSGDFVYRELVSISFCICWEVFHAQLFFIMRHKRVLLYSRAKMKWLLYFVSVYEPHCGCWLKNNHIVQFKIAGLKFYYGYKIEIFLVFDIITSSLTLYV